MPIYSRKLSKGIKWFYKFDYNGKTYFSKCIYPTKAEAKKAERDKFTELEQGTITDVRLAFLISERLHYIKSKKSERYYKNSRRYLFQLQEYFGDVEIRNITKNNLNKFFMEYSSQLIANGKDNYAVNALIRQVKALFNFAINFLDVNIKNPCVGIQMFSLKKKLKYIPTDREILAVLDICDDDQKLLVRFVLETGCRIGEALRFSSQDIGDDFIVLYTRKSINSNLTPRKLPMPDCLKGYSGKGRVFKSWTEQPKFLERKIQLLKLTPFGWHNLRHRYASLLSKQGVPIFEIMSKLGHSSLTTTQIYLQTLGG